MPIRLKNFLSITCDGCGAGFDEIDFGVKAEMELLKRKGWTGSYRKCCCPECSAQRKGKELKPND